MSETSETSKKRRRDGAELAAINAELNRLAWNPPLTRVTVARARLAAMRADLVTLRRLLARVGLVRGVRECEALIETIDSETKV